MNRNRLLIYVLVLGVLAFLVYLQFRHWQTFDWRKFAENTREITWRDVIYAILLIYFAYLLRAVRWKLFLRPVRKDVSTSSLVSPTLVGFTGLAILGRPGELIRPYLIGRRVNLGFASQLAVWAVERIFDLGAFTVLMILAIFLPTKLQAFATARPVYGHWLHLAGYLLSALVIGMFFVTALLNYKGPAIAAWIEERFAHRAHNLAHRIAQRVREFADGLNTIHGPISFLQLAGVSIFMWWLIALSYQEVTHAYADATMQNMSVSQVLLLMGSSMVGSMLQLPGVGGGSQLATIEALDKVFAVPREIAVSCGILLWLVSFVAVVPAGLLLAHRERLSLRKVAEESEVTEEQVPISTSSLD